MATRKELGAGLTEVWDHLNNDIRNCHTRFSGSTMIGTSTMELALMSCMEFEQRLKAYEKATEEYLALAPDMRSQVGRDILQLRESINEFRNSVGSCCSICGWPGSKDTLHGAAPKERTISLYR